MLPYHHDIQQQIVDIVFALHCISLMTEFLLTNNMENEDEREGRTQIN